jgi:hypothetical protein
MRKLSLVDDHDAGTILFTNPYGSVMLSVYFHARFTLRKTPSEVTFRPSDYLQNGTNP